VLQSRWLQRQIPTLVKHLKLSRAALKVATTE
jgi:hypothetical protein